MADDHSSHVAVDLGDLHDVATWLHHQGQSFNGDRDHLDPSVHFGHYSPCGDTQHARRAALTSLEDHHARWERHREELASLATALDEALDQHTDTGRGES